MSCPLHGEVWCSCPPSVELSVEQIRALADKLTQAVADDYWKNATMKTKEWHHELDCAVHSPMLRPCSCGLETRLKDRITYLTQMHIRLAKNIAEREREWETCVTELSAAYLEAVAFIENYAHHQFHPEKLGYAQSMESFRYNSEQCISKAVLMRAKMRDRISFKEPTK